MDKVRYFTNDLVGNESEWEEAAFRIVVEAVPHCTRKIFRERVEEEEEKGVIDLLKAKQKLPRVSCLYLRWLGIRNAYGSMLGHNKPFPYACPDQHKPPYSLAYLEQWYEQNHQGELAGEDVEIPRTLTVGVLEGSVMSPHDKMDLWKRVTKDQKVAKGLGPFEIILPGARDFTKVFGDLRPEALKHCLDETANLIGAFEIGLTLKIGDALRPTTLCLEVAGYKRPTCRGLEFRIAPMWDLLLWFGRHILYADLNIQNFIDSNILKRDHRPQTLAFDYTLLSNKWAASVETADDHQRHFRQMREAALKSKRMDLPLGAQAREMDRLENEVWAKALERLVSFDEKAKRLTLFVENGHPDIQIDDRSIRSLVAEGLERKLAADLIREVVAQGNENLVKVFVLEGDSRLPSLGGISGRLGLAEESESVRASASCARTMKKIHADLEA